MIGLNFLGSDRSGGPADRAIRPPEPVPHPKPTTVDPISGLGFREGNKRTVHNTGRVPQGPTTTALRNTGKLRGLESGPNHDLKEYFKGCSHQSQQQAEGPLHAISMAFVLLRGGKPRWRA